MAGRRSRAVAAARRTGWGGARGAPPAAGRGFVALAGIVAPPLAVLQTDLVLLVLFLLLVLFAATEPVAEQMFVADRRTGATAPLALLLVALRLPWPLVLASSAAPPAIV